VSPRADIIESASALSSAGFSIVATGVSPHARVEQARIATSAILRAASFIA
jgi:hypothetical protein